METQSIIVKIGGVPARDIAALDHLAAEIGELNGDGGKSVAVVHGGGADVSDLSRKLGLAPVFSDGIRMTTDEEMDVVDMVLCGLVNKRLVRRFTVAGIRAAGISGADGLLTGDRIEDVQGAPSRTAHVSAVRPDIVEHLWKVGYVPIIASPGSDAGGNAVNINADEAAFAIGGAVAASSIVFLSDVPGVKGADGAVIRRLSLQEGEELVTAGVISGGMVAKLRSSAGAIAAGVKHVVVGNYERRGDLARLVSEEAGTTIHGD